MSKGVLLYEDSPALRESIAQLLGESKDFLLLGSFPNALQVERQVRECKPDLILMDIDMPGGVTGIKAVTKVRTFDLTTPIIMLTVFDDQTNVLDAIFAGASGYLLKKHLSDHLLSAMQEVLAGGAPMSPSVARMVVASMHKSPTAGDVYGLTAREKEILGALAQGTGYRGIAAQLFISPETVRSHVKNIYQKMQVHTQLEAVAKGRSSGIV
jgi:DNA-binding NarL/FixJ family response regulator